MRESYSERIFGDLGKIADLEAENARLQGKACLICGRDTPCELDTNKDNAPNWPGSPCTFDPSPIDAARRFMQERDEARALAERRGRAGLFLWWFIGVTDTGDIDHGDVVRRYGAAARATLAAKPEEEREKEEKG